MGAGTISRMSRDAYVRLPGVNWSTLKHIAKSPAHYRHALTAEQKDSDAMKLGRVVHLAAFEPELYRAMVAVWTGGRRAGAEWKAFCAENKGRELLTEDEHEQCLAVQRAVQADSTARKYLQGCQSEVTVQWTHRLPGLGDVPYQDIDCKGRLDCLGQAAIVDLKTTKDASPEAFGRTSWNFKYHCQAAYYVDGVLAASGRRLPYVFIAVEMKEPWVVQVYVVPEAIIERGREEYRDLLERLAFCRAENRWPAYADAELELALPRWATFDNEDEDVTGLGLVGEGEGAAP